MKKDLYTWKETYIHEKRPIEETLPRDTRPAHMQSSIAKRGKEKRKRVCVCVCERAHERESERERVRESVCERERACGGERASRPAHMQMYAKLNYYMSTKEPYISAKEP